MPKTTISLTIESSVMDQARERINNVSALIENFLMTYLEIDKSEEIPEDMIDLMKEEESLVAQQAKIKTRLEKIARIKKKGGSVELDFSK